ncbi:MAG TPA: T9SS type A sorting domain-containing protein [Bacteroidia bacterium]|jgi:hypothetical protein
MKLPYKKQAAALLTAIAITGSACGQKAKVKTMTIINGDTTISEKEIGDKEIAEFEKQITMVINEDGEDGKKVIKKKIIINADDARHADAMAYAYSIGEGNGEDVEVTTDEDGKETRIVIKRDGDRKEGKDDKRTVVKRSRVMTDEAEGKGKMNLNIHVNNNIAKIEIETGSKEPLNISLLDENGKQTFYETQKAGGKYRKEIKLEKGTYFLNIIQNMESTTDKIIIK